MTTLAGLAEAVAGLDGPALLIVGEVRGPGGRSWRRRCCDMRRIAEPGREERCMKALTANRLDDGEVVFWSHGRWVARFADAELFDDEDAALAAEAQAPRPSRPWWWIPI